VVWSSKAKGSIFNGLTDVSVSSGESSSSESFSPASFSLASLSNVEASNVEASKVETSKDILDDSSNDLLSFKSLYKNLPLY
jgi:hypothetical protein